RRRRHAAGIEEAATVETKILGLADSREPGDQLGHVGLVHRRADAPPIADGGGETVEMSLAHLVLPSVGGARGSAARLKSDPRITPAEGRVLPWLLPLERRIRARSGVAATAN